jgi:pyruvate dehydrogenase E1 component
MHWDGDLDPMETRSGGMRSARSSRLRPPRAHIVLEEVIDEARAKGAPVPYSANTPYLNTIPPEQQAPHRGDHTIEHRIRSFIRWNALARSAPTAA